MRQGVALWFAIFLMAGGALAALGSDDAPAGLEGVPAVAAEINGHPIMREDLVRELAGSSGNTALGRLIRRMLVEQEANALQISVTDADIEAQYKVDTRDLMNELIRVPWAGAEKNLPFPIEDIVRTRFNMSVDEYKKQVIRQKLLIRRCIAKDLSPTQEQLLAFFNKYNDHFQTPTEYRASHILITPIDPRDFHEGYHFRSNVSQLMMEEHDRAERLKHIELYKDGIDLTTNTPPPEESAPEWKKKKAEAEKVLSDIKAGVITWEQALRQYTQDPHDHLMIDRDTKKISDKTQREKLKLPPGDVGWFNQFGPLYSEFYDVAKNIPKGQVGGPARTAYGYHLIKILDIKTSPPVTFEQCHDKVERAYIEQVIQLKILPVYSGKGPREPGWIEQLYAKAAIKNENVMLWPPQKAAASLDIGPAPIAVSDDTTDPIVVHVNGSVIRRSDVWRELVRYESDEALTRLINREIVLTMLKPMGVARMDWECARPDLKNNVPPPEVSPIQISLDDIDKQLNDDRLRLDIYNSDRQHARADAIEVWQKNGSKGDKPNVYPDLTFKEYIYAKYGETIDEYRRSIEASMVLVEAIRRMLPIDKATLKVQFALAREQYSEPAWFQISHIMVTPSGGGGGMAGADATAKLGARSIADNICQQCTANPERFEALVAEFSQDEKSKARAGVLGVCFSDGHRDPNQLYNAADVLTSDDIKLIYNEIKDHNFTRGQITPVIATSRGYHVVRVDAVHPEREVQFNEVRARLYSDFLNERAKMYSDIWIAELTRQSRIKRNVGGKRDTQGPPDGVPEDFTPPKK